MAVTNTVAGLNQTIGLLQQILTEIRSDKTVQPKAVSTVTGTSSDSGSTTNKKTTGPDLSGLGTATPSLQKNASTYASIIKLITSPDVLAGIKNFAKMKSLIAGFQTSFAKLIDAINGLKNLKISDADVKKFKTVIDSLIGVVNILPKLLLSLSLVIASAAAIGLLVVVAWPYVLLGLASISIILVGVALLVRLCSMILGGNSIISIKSKTGNLLTVKAIGDVVNILLSLSLLVLLCAGVGAVAATAWPVILLGFAIISVILAGVMLILKICKLMVSGTTWKKTLSTGGGTLMMVTSLALIVLTLMGISLLVLIAAGVGLLAKHHGGLILSGMIIIGIVLIAMLGILQILKNMSRRINPKKMLVITGSLLAIMGILLGISFLLLIAVAVGALAVNHGDMMLAGITVISAVFLGIFNLLKFLDKQLKSMGNLSKKFGEMFKNLALIMGLLVLVSVLIVIATLVGNMVIKNIDGVLAGFAAIGVFFGAVVGVIKIISKLAKTINSSVKKAMPTLFLVVALLSLMTVPVFLMAKLAKEVESAGGWGQILAVFGMMTAFVVAIGALCAVVGSAAPALLIAVGIGIVVFGAVAVLISIIANAMMKVVTLVNMIIDTNERLKGADIVTISKNIASAFSTFTDIIVSAFENIADRIKLKFFFKAAILNRMMDPVKKFINIIKDAHQYLAEADIPKLGSDIGSGFYLFTDKIVEIYDKVADKVKRKMRRQARTLNTMMDPVSKFVDIVIKAHKEVGNANLAAIATTIGEQFSTFATKLQTTFSALDVSFKDFWKACVLNKMIDPVIKFVEMIDKFAGSPDTISLINKDGKYKNVDLNNVISNIVTTFTNFATNLSNGYSKIEAKWSSKNKGEALESMMTPVSRFVEILSSIQLESDAAGNITYASVKDGSGKFVKVKNPSKTLNSLIDLMAEFVGLFSSENLNKKADTKALTTMTDSIIKFIESFSGMLEPINNFKTAINNTRNELNNVSTAIKNTANTTDTLYNKLMNTSSFTLFNKSLASFITDFSGHNLSFATQAKAFVQKNMEMHVSTQQNKKEIVELKNALNEFDSVLIDKQRKRDKAINSYIFSLKRLTKEVAKASSALSSLQDNASIEVGVNSETLSNGGGGGKINYERLANVIVQAINRSNLNGGSRSKNSIVVKFNNDVQLIGSLQ